MEDVAESTNKQRDHTDKGKFAKGNTLGNRFSKENQPENHPGRPPTKHLTDALLKHLEKSVKDIPFLVKIAKKLGLDTDKATGYEVLMGCAALHAAQGKGDILKQLYERIEGSIPKIVNLGPTDDFADYLDAMRAKTQFDPEEEPKDTPDAGTG